MSLFNQNLSFEELLHYDSIIDGKGIDTDVLLLQQSLQQPKFDPFNQHPFIPSNQQQPINNPTNQQPINQQPTNQQSINTQNSNDNTEIVKKNKKRQYIRLPNASISKHKHKYRKGKIEEVVI